MAVFTMMVGVAGFEDAYIKDEEYQCTFRFDPRDNDFVWEG